MEGAFETVLNSQVFKCSKCQKPLSVAPVISIIEFGSQKYLCGRCNNSLLLEKDSNPKAERQTLYEDIAKKMKFSCPYETEGCKQILQWDEVIKHEQDCEFSKIECFFKREEFKEAERCQWKGTNEEYFKHLEEHSEKVNEINKLCIWNMPKTRVIRIELFHNVILMFLLFLDNVYHIKMISKSTNWLVKYNVEISDETGENFSVFSKVSSFLPLDLEEILKFGLSFNPNLLKPKFFSISFMNENLCYEKCNAELLPCCDNQECEEKLKLPIMTCNYNHKFCKKCCAQIESLTACLVRNCNFYGFGDIICTNGDLEKEFLLKHYKCDTPNCLFHGKFHEMYIHKEFCKFILDKDAKISKLNYSYFMTDSEYFFIFNGTHFKLLNYESEDSFTLTIIALKSFPRHYYKITFDITTAAFTLNFAISPHFAYFNSYSENYVVIPKILFNQHANLSEKDKFWLKLNISRSF